MNFPLWRVRHSARVSKRRKKGGKNRGVLSEWEGSDYRCGGWVGTNRGGLREQQTQNLLRTALVGDLEEAGSSC